MKKWMKLLITLTAGIAVTAGVYAYNPKTEIMEYHVTADYGDTVWGICAKIATDEDNMQDLVRTVMRENNIKDAGDLRVGQDLVIHVKRVYFFGK